ncbi:MAG: alpha/beta hydrolase [Candidatus Tectimicrobiota bacterium]
MDTKVTFPSGDLVLEGRLWTSESRQDLGVVLCHPHPLHGGNLHNNVIAGVAETLWQHDVTTLRFNFRGTGASTGTHGGGETEGADVQAAVQYLLQSQAVDRLVLIGYSFGAGVGLLTGATEPQVSALVGIAPPVARRDFSLLHTCSKAKLFIVGDHDHVCPLPTLEALIAQCAAPTSMTLIPGANHFFLGREKEIAEAVVRFLGL